ncbi:MAG: hypothetical protein NTW96_16995 [Planctomycetia bacterium]|nr:hypothetical protein [Planctomycetia bacterium]
MTGSVMLLGCLLLGQAVGQAPNETEATVRRLVRQLDAPQLAQRDAAEQELIKLGQDVLDLLPTTTSGTSAEVQQRLARVRHKFEQMAAESAAEPSRVTLRGDPIKLSKCLEEISRQTGNRIVDFREKFNQEKTDPDVKVNFEKTPFWKALDDVLGQAKLTVYPFGAERAVCVVGRPETTAPTAPTDRDSFDSGPFRFTALDLVARRGLRDPSENALRLRMQVAWEPRLAPITLKQAAAKLKAVDEQGRSLAVEGAAAELEVPVDPSAVAVELTLPLALPPREVKRIERLDGTLEALLPGREETFRFDKLTDAKDVEKRVAGVTVTLERVRKNNEVWEVWVRVQFDQASGALESHRGWVFNNPAYLEGPDGKRIDNDGFETTRRTENEIGLAYLFDLEKPPTDLTFVYKTPSTIISTSFDYQFKAIELP